MIEEWMMRYSFLNLIVRRAQLKETPLRYFKS